MKKSACLFLAVILTVGLSAQTTPIDSLDQLYPSLSVTEKVDFQQRIEAFFQNNLNLNDVRQYRNIAEKYRDSLFMGNSYGWLANSYERTGNQDSAQIFRLKQREIQTAFGWYAFATNGLLHNTLQVYQDTSSKLTFSKIRDRDHLFGFNNTRSEYQPKDVYWAKVILRGHPERAGEYFIRPADYAAISWMSVDAYLVRANGRVEEQKTGWALDQKDKLLGAP